VPGAAAALARCGRRARGEDSGDSVPLLEGGSGGGGGASNSSSSPSSYGSSSSSSGGYSKIPSSGGPSASAAALGAAEARISELQAEVDTYKAMVFAGANSGGGAGAMLAAGSAASGAAAAAAGGKGGASSDLAAASVWDRREFLQRCADHVGLVATALDESVADAMATGTGASAAVLAASMQRLWASAAAAATEVVRGQKERLLDASAGDVVGASSSSSSSSSSSRVLRDRIASSTLFAVYSRGILEATFSADALWAEKGTRVLDAWCASLVADGVCSPESAEGLFEDRERSGLGKAVLLALRTTAWPLVTGSPLEWTPGAGAGASSSSSPTQLRYDQNAQQVFSLDGRPTSAGDRVAAVGPTLTLNPERVPADGTAPDLASLRKQCKTLVVPVGK
jgi:hypothetical protein